MARLRDPERGCPWDREQDFATIAPYTIEETYEVADAIARGDMPALKDELGDLLFQVVFHARMAEETGLFDFDDSRRGDRRQDGAAPSACVRQCADRFGGGAERSLGATQSGRAAGSRRERTLSQALTLQYDKIVFIWEPSEQPKAAIGKRATVVDYPDGRLAIRYRGVELAYRTL